MKRSTFFALVFFISLFISACSENLTEDIKTVPPPSQIQSQTQPADITQPLAKPEVLNSDIESGLTEAHEDVQGDIKTHNTYYDEENELLLSYPVVFSPDGEPDPNGYMRFPSLQDDCELLYWVTPNTYEESPAEFMERIGSESMAELEGNAVIGKMNDIDQQTGEGILIVCYWVVDTETIVNVEIICDTPEYAETVFGDLQNSAVFIESVAGISF